MLSDCCDAPPLEFFDLDFDLTFQNKPSGMCGECKDHCEFDCDEEDE